MAFCAFCGARVREDAKFCPDCGAKVVATVQTPTRPVEKEAAPSAKKKKSRWKWLIVPVVIVLAAVVFSGKAKQMELLRYINEEIPELAEIEEEMLDSYNSVTGSRYVDDETTYTEITERTLELSQELCEEARKLEFENKELRDVHKIYVRYTSEFRNALIKLQDAVVNQDYDAVIEANDYLDEANDICDEFMDALEALMKKYAVVWDD